MILKRNLHDLVSSPATTGVSTAQIIAIQGRLLRHRAGPSAKDSRCRSSVILLYLLRPILFNLVAGVMARPSPKAP